jgi:hypothetical protein
MKTENIIINQKVARELLEKNKKNRPIRPGYVTLLATEMAEGRWRDNTGDSIKISKDDILLDGQHRLEAVLESKVTIKTTIATGVDPDAMDVIDIGMKRQASDILMLNDVKYSPIVSAVIKYVNANGLGAGMSSHSTFTSNREVLETYSQDSVFWDNVAKNSCRWYSSFKTINPKLFGGCYALALRESKHPQKVNVFFDMVADGKQIPDVIHSLRKKLINNAAVGKSQKYTNAAKRDLIKSHFNGFVKGQKTPSNETKWL